MKHILAVAFFLSSGASVLAEPSVYECRAQQKNYSVSVWNPFDNLIQSQMRFTIDGDSVVVDDPLVRSVYGGPVQGTLTENTAKKFVARWDLVARGFQGRQATMLFRAAYLKERKQLIVTQSISGSGTSFHARGNCLQMSGVG